MEEDINIKKGNPTHEAIVRKLSCITGCGGKHGQIVFESQEYVFIECENCKTVNRSSVAAYEGTAESFTGYESEGNYRETAPLLEFFADKFVAAAAKKFIDHLKQYQIKIDGAKILEVGCGKGRFLEVLQSKADEVTGIEPTYRSFVKARKRLGHVVVSGDYLDRGIKTEYDTIFLNHVFEHFKDVDRLMGALTQNLNRNGTIVITIPNVESQLARANIGFWYQLDPIYHEHFFTFSGMKAICAKHDLEIDARFTYFPEIDRFSFAYTKLNERKGERAETQVQLKSSGLAMVFSSPLRALELFWLFLSSGTQVRAWRKTCSGDSVTYLIKNKNGA